jgi:serine/threonine protein kinase
MNLRKSELYINNFIDRFRFNKLLGTGSFSKVYSVFDKVKSRTVALKMNKHYRICFENEIYILSNLKQKEQNNITKMFESFSYNDSNFILFKMYHISLKEYIKSYQSSVPKTLDITHQITSGLTYLKKNNIIHRDIKTENILFKDSSQDTIVLIDFGISIRLDNNSIDINKNVQTIYYRAPEIILGSVYDYKIDMWSLGCVVYEIFYRTPLFQCKNNDELFLNQNIIFDPPEPDFIKKHPKIYHFYDNIDSPSCLIYNNNIYAFKKYKFIATHQEPEIIDIVLRCCCWDLEKRPTPEKIFTL